MHEPLVEGFRLSLQQHRSWLLQQADHHDAYRAQCLVRIDGIFGIELFQAAVVQLVNRHEILRTSFQRLPEMIIPLQVIQDGCMPKVQEHDLRELEAEQQAAKLAELRVLTMQQPLAYEQGSLLDVRLVRLSKVKQLLLVSLPALCTDRAGLKNLVSDLSRCYDAVLRDQELVGQARQYVDVSEWQHQLLEEEDTKTGRDYWRRRSINGAYTLAIPYEKKVTGGSLYAPHLLSLEIDRLVTQKLKAVVQKYDITTSDFSMGCWQTLLGRLATQSDVVVEIAFDGRNHEELKETLGLFTKHLPMHSRLEKDMRFCELTQAIARATKEFYTWQGFFTWGKSEAAPENPLAAVSQAFGFEWSDSPAPYAANGVTFSIVQQYACTDRFKIKLLCEARDDVLHVELRYDSELYRREDIQRLGEYFQTLVASAANNPDAKIGELEILGEQARQQQLFGWNNTRADWDNDHCVHELFEAQVERTPEALALVYEDEQLTYAELNARANQLARHLQRQGIGPETLVGILMERSIEMVVALLGVLKAGGAYLPLDPHYPAERLRFMSEDSMIRLVLTRAGPCEATAAVNVETVILDRDWQGFAQESPENPTSGVRPANLAYVIYTSGSTGKPKGVLISHHSIANRLLWMQHNFSLTAADRVLQKTPFSFDASVWELFVPLLTGASLVLAQPKGQQDSAYLVAAVRAQQITVLQLVPSMLRLFLEEADARECRTLRLVFCGGEVLTGRTVSRFSEVLEAELVNLYGPTEVSIDASYWRCQGEVESESVPIGRPLSNVQMYALDEELEPVAVGVTGQLHIGGAGLARGYLQQAESTAERFIPNPFSETAGSRLYQTGDLARYLPDGNVEFLGRVDHQVKVRGYRIELGEVEAALSGHQGVRECAVVVRGEAEEKQLVAYCVARAKASLSMGELRRYVAERLPDYMIPSAFVLLPSLPRQPNGKIDRRALPVPELSRIALEQQYVAPGTPVQELLAAIWSEVLGQPQVGIHDNFFELGGHSLLATQVISRVRETFGVEIALRSLFEFPSISALAVSIEKALRTSNSSRIPAIRPVSREAGLALSFAQQRLWFLDQLEPGSAAYNIPASVRLSGALQLGALEQSLNEIIRRHESLRTSFGTFEGQPVQVIAAAEWVELAVIDLSGFGEEEREAAGLRLAQEEAQRPFDLARGPLLRVSLLRLAEQEHIALLTMHHIISDGWSVGVMIREVAALYEAYVGGGTSPLAELPIQYADYAVWQREWLSGSVLDEQLAYWKQQLGGELPVLELPTDYARPALQSFEGGREHLSLPAELSEGLRAVSRSEGVTLFMTLLTLWQVLLSRWSGQDDVIVGVPIAGRTQVEVEGLIGFFVNTLPLRADLRGEPSFRELLRRVREVTLGAYANQELPFEKLVEELQPERNLNRHPIFDVLFNFINTPQEALELSGLTISYPNLSAEDSKFAMTLYVEEQESSLDLSLAYRRDLFSQERMACLLSQYQNLLRQAVAAPEKLVQDYSLVTPESSYLLPDPTADLSEPQYRPVTEMFLDQADRAPASAAMQQGDHIWTYAELSEKAKAISGILLSSKLNAGDVVAVIGPRSFGLIASMLGVLLSRGVLLTIDTVFPVERQRLMLHEAGAKRIICIGPQLSEAEFTAPPGSFDVMSVNPHQGVVESPKEYLDHQAFKPPEIAPDDPAYVFFTSGTTGIPMGVLGSHKGLGHFLTWQRATFEVGPEDRCAQLTGLSFDVVLRDIFLPLVSGATLCLPKAIDDLRAERIVPWLADERITLLHTVPSLAQSWLQHPGSRPSLQNLRLTFFAGEPLTDVLVHRWRAAFSQMGKIVNLYGPTETTLAKCFYVVPPDVTVGTQLVGAPLPQTQVLILSQNNRLCGIGEAGEIVIRTPFRSLGYVNPTQKDQRRFIKNPYRDDQHDLLYRTGDRGRYTLNGMVEILGRLDDQVKIRGQRIEPGEVEIVLSGHAGVQQAVVIVHEDELGDKRLVAYVVGQPLQLLTIDQLRRFLKERLPQHMVPSGFVMIDKLPLTPNGKVDRGALPSMSRAVRFESDSTYLAPRNSLEEVIAGIWGGVLKLERVGINDNFFAVGGHSLLAMHIIAQLREIFQVELPLRSLFEEPTIAGTAAVLLSDSQRQAKVEKTARLLMSLTHLSESEVEAMLDRKVSLQG